MNDSVDLEELERIIKEAINETFAAKDGKDVTYIPSKIETWSNTVQDKCLQKIIARESKLKACVTCIIMQKTGAALHTTAATFWERNEADIFCTVPWENNSLHCIVTIYAMKAFPTVDPDEDMYARVLRRVQTYLRGPLMDAGGWAFGCGWAQGAARGRAAARPEAIGGDRCA